MSWYHHVWAETTKIGSMSILSENFVPYVGPVLPLWENIRFIVGPISAWELHLGSLFTNLYYHLRLGHHKLLHPIVFSGVCIISYPQINSGQFSNRSDKSHNATVPHSTMYQFVIEMCTFVWQSGALRDMSDAWWDLWDGFNEVRTQIRNYISQKTMAWSYFCTPQYQI